MSWIRTTSVMTVKKVEERTQSNYLSGVGKDAKFEDISLGWYVTFREWPQHAVFIGNENPKLEIGDSIILDMFRNGVRR